MRLSLFPVLFAAPFIALPGLAGADALTFDETVSDIFFESTIPSTGIDSDNDGTADVLFPLGGIADLDDPDDPGLELINRHCR